VPFISLSGYSSDQLPEIFQRAPMLTKPVDLKKLVHVLRGCLEGRSSAVQTPQSSAR
jgi:hypothetical protein